MSLVAYVIREDKSISISDKEWLSLTNIALSEPMDTGVRSLLLAGAFTKTPESFSNSSLLKDLKNALLEYNESSSQDLYYLCLAYADKGTTNDAVMLAGLLDHDVNDVRKAASYAILKINKRMTDNK